MSSLPDVSGLIVEAVADDAALQHVSVEMGRLMDAESVLIQSIGPQGPTAISAHISPALVTDYERHFWRHDLWISDLPSSIASRISFSDQYVDPRRMANSEIYNDLLRKHGDIFRVLGFKGALECGDDLFVGVHRARSRDFRPIDVQQIFHLRPSLINLVNARRRLTQNRGRLAARIVDAEADPAMVVTATGQLCFANLAAVRMLEAGPLRSEAGRLVATDRQLAKPMLLAVRAACHGRLGRVFAIEGGDVHIAVDPLEGCMSGPGAAGAAPLALVRVRDGSARRAEAVSAATGAWGLTPAERALADALLRGITPAEHARARGVSLPTVRTQLRSLYAKAGVGGRAPLVRRLSEYGRA